MILDIGCGGKPKGTVNLDLFIRESPHHKFYKSPREIPNFIICDATHLAIRDKTFETVYCSHVLEHLLKPNQGIEEIARISRNRAIIVVPNDPKNEEHRMHLYSWSKRSLTNLLSRYFNQVEVNGYTRVGDISGRLFKILDKFSGRFNAIGKPIFRALCSYASLELIAMCFSPIQKHELVPTKQMDIVTKSMAPNESLVYLDNIARA